MNFIIKNLYKIKFFLNLTIILKLLFINFDDFFIKKKNIFFQNYKIRQIQFEI